ncbi:MAG: sporulation protein YqfC [Thermotaleaceae bacterium]
MQSKTKEIKESLSELLELPKDIILDLPRITLLGDMQMYVENHKGIVEYSQIRIRVKVKNGILRITGKELSIKSIVTDEIIICGSIESVEFTK